MLVKVDRPTAMVVGPVARVVKGPAPTTLMNPEEAVADPEFVLKAREELPLLPLPVKVTELFEALPVTLIPFAPRNVKLLLELGPTC